VIAVAESDSYLKWAVSLLAQLPAPNRIEIVIACSPVRPSVSQAAAALSGSTWAERKIDVVTPARLAARVERTRPDAVLLACTGPSLHAYEEALSHISHRPVLLAGIPGIALPSRKRAWNYRGAIDLMVVHSHREVEEYDRTRLEAEKNGQVGLATIPFLSPTVVSSGREALAAHQQGKTTASNRVLFATQAKVPNRRRDRVRILLALDRLAADRPDLEVVVKTRGLSGEFHTHHEKHHFGDLWEDLVRDRLVADPGAVKFAAGSMAEQLMDAAALVTVSSTAVLEAMALRIPVLLLDDFGVNDSIINTVFVGSGCLGGLSDLERADFRQPEDWWLEDNYFHPPSENTWIPMLDELVARARAGQLAPIAAGLDPARSAARRRRDRLRLTPAGSALVRGRHRARLRIREARRRVLSAIPRPGVTPPAGVAGPGPHPASTLGSTPDPDSTPASALQRT
jgi:hypothetical protein